MVKPSPLSLIRLFAFFYLVSGFTLNATEASYEFFEKRIRPVLVHECYECHNSTGKRKAGLALDSRDALRAGGDSGSAIVVGDPEKSLLIRAVRHADPDLKMPKSGAKLGDASIADLEKWIASGAPDPRDNPPSKDELASESDWNSVAQRRLEWWSFQPIRSTPPPLSDAVPHPIDAFLAAKQNGASLSPAPPADPATLLRRTTFALTGLPPEPKDIDSFKALYSSDPDAAFASVVDRLLASPQFGERWARHWMDWFRYAESHGSEGDPAVPHAWRYRDYLIRALNADIPYDQLVREHLAGDLLDSPRSNHELGINESMLGLGHLRMVFHGFAPTDALDEFVRFTDNQVDVVSKALLGLTVSCARCHNHKFDPISHEDYYAIYGVFASTRPALRSIDLKTSEDAIRRQLSRHKNAIRDTLVNTWKSSLSDLDERLTAPIIPDVDGVLKFWNQFRAMDDPDTLAKAIVAELDGFRASKISPPPESSRQNRGGSFPSWQTHGSVGTDAKPTPAGEFSIRPEGDQIIDSLLPAGFYSHLVSTKDSAAFTSPRIRIEPKHSLYAQVAGDGDAMIRYAVQNYPRNGTVYPVTSLKGGNWRWVKFDLSYWEGDDIHIELTTAADSPVLAKNGNTRSWFGIRDAVVLPSSAAPPSKVAFHESLIPIFELCLTKPPKSPAELAAIYTTAAKDGIERLKNRSATDADIAYLNSLLSANLLPRDLKSIPEAAPHVEAYRKLEAALRVPTRAPGVAEGDIIDHPLYTRGNHKTPADPIPRRFLEVFDPKPYPAGVSGRLQLAEDILDPANTLPARVIVNRLWHHLFGRGLVATTDNFGRLGSKPSHPELLDFLAAKIRDDGWSIKRTIRFIVTSAAFQRSSIPPPRASEKDPENLLLSHFPIRRLEAEAIRDAILSVSGRLDPKRGGPAVNGNASKRSVYVNVIRNRLDPFLSAFDAPEPLSTRGRRDITNVPAQSLTLLNDRFVIDAAKTWARQLPQEPDAHRIKIMFRSALSRDPSPSELNDCLAYLAQDSSTSNEDQTITDQLRSDLKATTSELAALVDPVRQRLKSAAEKEEQKTPPPPSSFASWNFASGNLTDASEHRLDAKTHGSARIESGKGLILDGRNAFASTPPVPRDITEKTLEAWVRLDGLDQRGGGVIGIQTLDGHTFDAIVFGEQEPRKWMTGSNHFARTAPFGGPSENEAKSPVHIAFAYAVDGTITAFRNGSPYGKPIRKSDPITYKTKSAQILFGLRHGTAASGNRLLKGEILSAKLYARALTPEEVSTSFRAGGGATFISDTEVLAALDEKTRQRVIVLREKRDQLQQDLRRRRELAEKQSGTENPWEDLALSIFNLKEFIYIR